MNETWIITDENDENLRLDNYLSELFESFSRSYLQKLIKDGKVKVNDKVQKPSYKTKLKDKIELVQEEIKEILPQNIPLDIVWEDENMAVVNKPSDMLTHPSEIERENTLVNALLFKYGENLSDLNGYFRKGIVHRLDRNTSGLLMIAKNNKAHEFLAEQFRAELPSPLWGEGLGVRGHSKTLEKEYLAVVKGAMKENFGVINFPIGRHPKQPHKMAVVEDGKPCITEFKVIKRFKEHTYLELNLKTGRTHQIRVHLSHIGHPILNDTLYGAGTSKVKTQEQVLQSYKLKFTKPFSDDTIELEIEPDEKIQKVLKYLENIK